MIFRVLSCALLGGSLLVPAQAAVRNDLSEPTLAARIDGEPVSLAVIAVMQRVSAQQTPGITTGEVLQGMMDDRLIAAYARQHYSVAELMEDNKVGYKPAVQFDQSFVATLQSAYMAELKAAVSHEKSGSLNGVITSRHAMTTMDWDSVLGKHPTLTLEYSLDEKAQRAARKITLLSYRFDKKTSGSVSFWDVYNAQHVQGRNQLHNRDAEFAEGQAKTLVMQRYVQHWAATRSTLGAVDYALLKQAVIDKMLRNGWMALSGVSNDIHDNNAHLDALAAAATPAEIQDFYEKNREQFRRVEKVKARHMSLPDEAAANAAYARLKQKEDFATVAKSVSVAADREQGGDLGWIIHGDKNATWLQNVAFLQKTGVPSNPFRSPGEDAGVVWEIVLLEERVDGYQAPDSSSVRYVAAQAIARQKALAEYRDMLKQLRNAADIHVSPAIRLVLDEAAAKSVGVLK